MIEKADLIVAERFLVGKEHLANLQTAIEAIQKGKKVIVLENIREYEFTGQEAEICYQRLKEGGAVFIPDHSRLLEEVEKVLS